jgi:hypothetical protein
MIANKDDPDIWFGDLGGLDKEPGFVWAMTELRNKQWGPPKLPRTTFQDGGSTTEYEGCTAYLAPGKRIAYAVQGEIRAAYQRLRTVSGLLGYPTSNQTATRDGVGQFNTFQGGVIYLHPDVGAFEIHGAILERWRAIGAETFGYPMTDETSTADGFGRFNHFRAIGPNGEHWDSSIYYTPWKGAWDVIGAIRDKWMSMGAEASWLGYPVSAEEDDGSTRVSHFEKGLLRWTPGNVAVERVSGGLQFRLRYMQEHAATDNLLQGANDEVYLTAIGVDPSRVAVSAGGDANILLWHAPMIGDISADAVRQPMKANPHVLVDFDLHAPGEWPREFAVTLFLVEHDNRGLATSFAKVERLAGAALKDLVKKQVEKLGAAAAGAVVGSVVPGLGTAIGAGAGYAVAAAYEPVKDEILSGLANEVFEPITLTIRLDSPNAVTDGVDVQRHVDVREHGAHYTLFFDWHRP